MSEIRVNELKSEDGTGAPSFPVGIVTVTDSTESTATDDGAVVILGGVGIAKSLNVGGNVTVGGTLTYEDVTNQDVLGLSTYRNGLNVGSEEGSGTGVAITFTNQGNAYFGRTGIVTATQFVGILTGTADVTVGVGTTATTFRTVDGATQNNFGGVMKEDCAIIGAKAADASIDLAKGNVQYFTTNGTGATTAALIYAGGNNISNWMALGDNVSVIKAFSMLADKLSEDEIIKGEGTGYVTAKEIENEISELTEDGSPYWNKTHPNHKKTVDQVFKLREQLNG